MGSFSTPWALKGAGSSRFRAVFSGVSVLVRMISLAGAETVISTFWLTVFSLPRDTSTQAVAFPSARAVMTPSA